MAENQTVLLDEDGAASDWIEIYNNTAAPVAMFGWYLTDNLSSLTKWQIPAITLPAGVYQIIFASSKNRTNVNNPLHTSFSLSGSGESVALVRPNGTTINSQFANYPAQTANVSYGSQGGTGFMCPTPGAANTASGANPCLLGCSSLAGSSEIVISEFAASQTTVFDRDNESSDWIELRNTTASDYLMHDWYLTDCSGNLRKWRIPDLTIPAGGYKVIFASGKDLIADVNELHTSFSLAQSGEYLGLIRPDGSIANHFSPTFPAQTTDISYGVQGATTGFMCPTPEAANTTASGTPPAVGSCPPTALPVPAFDFAHGFYDSSISVQITTTALGSSIIYTTDGSAPTRTNPNAVRVDAANAGSTPAATVAVTTTTILRAIVIQGILTSRSFSQTYIFPADVEFQPDNRYSLPSSWPGYSLPVGYAIDPDVLTPSQADNGFGLVEALQAIPTLSISSDQPGLLGTATDTTTSIYARPLKTQNGDLERAASVELIYPDGAAGFQINAGLKMHGGFSRNHDVTPKHSFDVLFKSSFGPTTLEFPLFPDTPVSSFNRLVLRACATDSWPVTPGSALGGDPEPRWVRTQATYMRDQWMRDSQIAMGDLSPHGIYVHLYLNGLYWGLYNISERVDESFAASHLGGVATSYDVMEVDDEAGLAIVPRSDSDRLEWDAMMGGSGVGAGDDAGYLRLRGWSSVGVRNTSIPVYLNMQAFIDYMILHIYSRADDWPVHNWLAVRREDSPGVFDSDGYRFVEWDQELSNMSLNDDHISWSPFNTFETVNQSGPALLYDRLRNNSPLFRAEFKQRVIALMAGTGPLTPIASHQRWLRRANEIDRAILGEAARWGDERESQAQSGEVFPFTRKHWLANTSYLLNSYWHENLTETCSRFSGLTLGLLPDPFIVQVPKSQTVPEGAAATFTSSGFGTGLAYQWFRNGTAISGATSSSYSIASASRQHAGYYSVRYQNANGTQTSDSALLTVVSREELWLADGAPAGATTGAQGGDSWSNWVPESTLKPFSGSLSLQSANYAGFHQLYYTGATPSPVKPDDVLFVYVYVDTANPPQEIMLQWYTDDDQTWWHRAYWGGTQIQSLYSYMTGVAMGPIPPGGGWVRLEVPANLVNLPGRQVSGMALTLFGGRVTWDHAGKRSGGDLLWIDDSLPPSPYTFVTGSSENWSWVADAPRPISGKLAVQSANLSGVHQVYFAGTKDNWYLNTNDVLFAHVLINSGVEEVMLQWVTSAGVWKRAYWGTDHIAVGKTRIGDLPAAGTWARLQVPVATLGLQGATIQGLAFTLYGGQATWDSAGKTRPETVWFDDQPPAGATLVEQGDSWSSWDAVILPVSGTAALHSATASGFHQMFCYDATATLPVVQGDAVFVYVYLNSGSMPTQLMLQWYTSDGVWHRANWGATTLNFGPQYQVSNSLPTAGGWVRLEVPASLLGLEGKTVTGLAFTLYGGTATWDKVGKVPVKP